MSSSGYMALVLDEESKARIINDFPPLFPKRYADHVTVIFSPSRDDIIEYMPLVNKEFDIQVIGWCGDDKAEALAVKVDGIRIRNSQPHITLSCDEGVSPKYSNEMFGEGLCNTFPEPFFIKGKLTWFVYNGPSD